MTAGATGKAGAVASPPVHILAESATIQIDSSATLCLFSVRAAEDAQALAAWSAAWELHA